MARKDKDFVGLEVISLEDATVVGKVDGLIVDASERRIGALVVGLGIHEAKVIPQADVVGIGDDAVTVRGAGVVKRISECPPVEELARRGVQLADELVLTDGGDLVGVVSAYFVDPHTGDIRGLELSPGPDEPHRPSHTVRAKDIVSLGKELVIVRAGSESRDAGSGESL
jgi:uncharacterized protein YrrD